MLSQNLLSPCWAMPVTILGATRSDPCNVILHMDHQRWPQSGDNFLGYLNQLALKQNVLVGRTLALELRRSVSVLVV